jgi:hypothetical protein
MTESIAEVLGLAAVIPGGTVLILLFLSYGQLIHQLQNAHKALWIELGQPALFWGGRPLGCRPFNSTRNNANIRRGGSGETSMIARHWRGWTKAENADAYEALLRIQVLPELAKISGYRGGYVLRGNAADEVEFVIINLFASIEARGGLSWKTLRFLYVRPDGASSTAYPSQEAPLFGCASKSCSVRIWPRAPGANMLPED